MLKNERNVKRHGKRKRVLFYFLVGALFACGEKSKTVSKSNTQAVKSEEIVVPEFQTILDSARVKGAILIHSPAKEVFYSNDFNWSQTGKLPASTFKIPNAIIALETGVVKSDTAIFKWNGEPRALPVWEQDLSLKEAFHVSCVPCYQEVAREVGVARMNEYLRTLGFGKMVVDSTNIDMFWLAGTSRITPFEQIDFLQRFYNAKLGISKRTETRMKQLMLMNENEEYRISGKTGWSISEAQNNGWFVGFVEKEETVCFFATNIEPQPSFDMKNFPEIRKTVTYEALRRMGIIPER